PDGWPDARKRSDESDRAPSGERRPEPLRTARRGVGLFDLLHRIADGCGPEHHHPTRRPGDHHRARHLPDRAEILALARLAMAETRAPRGHPAGRGRARGRMEM